jgi:hypothetical protein
VGLKGLKQKLVPPILATRPGESITPDQLHAVVIAFPGSGRSWLRMMLARVFELQLGLPGVAIEQLAALKPHPRVPMILYAHDDYPQWKTPEELDHDKTRYRNESVIFLSRDPRDILVSNYYQKSKGFLPPPDGALAASTTLAPRVQPFAGSIEEFAQQEIGGLDTIISYLNIWNENREATKKFLHIRYEDLNLDTAATLKKVARFLGFSSISDAIIQEAVKFGSIDNMRALEAKNDQRLPFLLPGNVNDPESYKTRRGEVGAFCQYLSAATVLDITTKVRAQLSPDFRYAL